MQNNALLQYLEDKTYLKKASKLNILTLVGFKETYLLTIEVIIASAFFLDKLREMI